MFPIILQSFYNSLLFVSHRYIVLSCVIDLIIFHLKQARCNDNYLKLLTSKIELIPSVYSPIQENPRGIQVRMESSSNLICKGELLEDL